MRCWVPLMVENVPTPDPPMVVGSRLRQAFEVRGHRWATTAEVIELIQDERLGLSIDQPRSHLQVLYDLSGDPEGTTIMQSVENCFSRMDRADCDNDFAGDSKSRKP